MKTTTSSRLLQYSAASAAFVAGASVSPAAIIATTANLPVNVGATVDIDMDNDSDIDFRIISNREKLQFSGSGGSGYSSPGTIRYRGTLRINAVTGGILVDNLSTFFATPLPPGSPIPPASNFFNNLGKLAGTNSFTYDYFEGRFPAYQVHYIGVRGPFGSNDLRYGWIALSVNGDYISGTVLGWAYDDSGAGIVAGQTESPVPEPSSLALLATGAAGLAVLRRRSRS